MMRRLPRFGITATFSALLLQVTSSCSLLQVQPAPEGLPHRTQEGALRSRVVQVDFGRAARYAVCAEPACPKITPKTIAPAQVTALPTKQPAALRFTPSDDDMPVTAPVQAAALPPKVVVEPESRPAVVRGEAATKVVVVNFAFGSSTLSSPARGALDAAMAAARQSDRIVIAGRTDSIGNQRANELLAQARAEAVESYIRAKARGLSATITVDAKGRCCFVAPNETETGRARNRRVEVAFIAEGVL